MIVSCSYLLYEYLLKLKKNIVLGLVLGLVILSSASALASWFCPRPRPRPRGFVLVLGLVLRSLASINMTAKMILRKAATDTKNIS